MKKLAQRLEALEQAIAAPQSGLLARSRPPAIPNALDHLKQQLEIQDVATGEELPSPPPIASRPEAIAPTSTLQGNQQVDKSQPTATEWNVYLHHPRGTVELIEGPFADQEQAKSQIISAASFGLFPESKGYKWECRAEKGTPSTHHQTTTELPSEPSELLTQAQLKGLSGRALASRLGVGDSTLRRRKAKLDFQEWSRDRDPDGTAWKLREGLFYPTQ